MSAENFYEDLLSAVALEGDRAVLRISTTYEPGGGPGSKVFPPTYPARPQSGPYLIESRWVDGVERADVVLDSVPSQANRVEESLLRARRDGLVELPLLELRHSGDVEVVLTSLEFPHRYADAYVRDSRIDGVPFDKTELGVALRAATPADATALLVNDPGSLVFGAWDSHRKGRQQRFPRIYSSELVGWDPVEARRNAGRMDPLNLTGAAKRPKDDGEWEYAPAGQKVKGEKLSEIGHGNVAPNPQHGGVTISTAQRFATISLAGLDRIGFGEAGRAASLAGRALLAAYALLGDRLAFSGPGLWLRSGCELTTTQERVEWIGRGGAQPVELTRSEALEVFRIASEQVAKQGLPLQTNTVVMTPSPELAKAIDFSLTKADAGDK